MKHKLFYKRISNSAEETKKVAESFAGEILRHKPQKSAVVLALSGNLGAGKTAFLQGFAKGLGIKEKITSPTFILMKRFKISDLRFKNFYHMDCYRLNNSKEILDLRFKEIISNPENIIAVEWPEKIHKILPKNAVKIKFKHLRNDQRKITLLRNVLTEFS